MSKFVFKSDLTKLYRFTFRENETLLSEINDFRFVISGFEFSKSANTFRSD